MIDQTTHELSVKLGNFRLAEKLVNAGLKTPEAIQRVSDSQLLAIKGIGVTQVSNIRKKLR